jgi:hypothetical protein
MFVKNNPLDILSEFECTRQPKMADFSYPQDSGGWGAAPIFLNKLFFLDSDAIDAKTVNYASLIQIIQRKWRALRAYGAGALHAT